MDVKILLLILSILFIFPIVIANNSSPRAQTNQGVYIGQQTTTNGWNVNY